MMRRRALDRLFFFGEAGQFNPPASATPLTRMLYTYKATAQFLAEGSLTNGLSRRDLNYGPPPFNWFNKRFQLGLFEGILRWDSDTFSSVLGELRRTGDDALLNDIMFGNLGASSVPVAACDGQAMPGAEQKASHACFARRDWLIA